MSKKPGDLGAYDDDEEKHEVKIVEAVNLYQAHLFTPPEVLAEFSSDGRKGMSTAAVEKARARFGFNELPAEKKTSMWELVLQQFDDLLVKILLASAGFSFVIALIEGGEHGEGGLTAFVEPGVILLILVLNAIVGVWQESNAENALEALKNMQPSFCKCLRDGVWILEHPSRELIPGDVVEINVGNKVPADIRLMNLETTTINIDESMLTGESVTKLKECHTLPKLKAGKEHKYACNERINMCFSGTQVSQGKARGIVVGTGLNSELGSIAGSVSEDEDDKSPLKQKIDQFGEQLAQVIGVICLLVWVMNYSKFNDPVHGSLFKGMIYYLKIAVALGVAAIPEGLPAVITLCLALGTRQMVKKHCIIRKLPSVETLGCTTVICSDKTGTLTKNEMTVVEVILPTKGGLERIMVNTKGGKGGYDPSGSIEGFGAMSAKTHSGVLDFARCCSLNNNATILFKEGQYIRTDEPTEAALKVLVEKIGVFDAPAPAGLSDTDKADYVSKFHAGKVSKEAVLEFSRGARKSMSTLCHVEGSDSNVLYVKGAPEMLVPRCTSIRYQDGTTEKMTPDKLQAVIDQVNAMAGKPLRTLALAIREDFSGDQASLGKYVKPALGVDPEGVSLEAHNLLKCPPDDLIAFEQGLTLLGVVGIMDPPREGVAEAIEKCTVAGIRVIMITGDNKNTAEAIAKDIGIVARDADLSELSFTGAEFFDDSKYTMEDRKHLLIHGGGGRVFSRTDPHMKKALVKLMKDVDCKLSKTRTCEVAAMTGDGVNDAPALKAASIGIAMGIAGTEVAKEASDMILADDNFATIVDAVEQGRSIYQNMKAFIRYLISSNIGEVASIFITALLGFPEGLIPVQLLWVNLVTDGPPATALGFNPVDADIMRKPPRREDDQLITQWVFFRYMVIGLYVGFATVGIFAYWYIGYESPDGHTLVTLEQLRNWGQCSTWDGFAVNDMAGYGSFAGEHACDYFTRGKRHASTLSLSVLVTIEMFNALNALSEDGSLLVIPPWCNLWLLAAMAVSFALHALIMYVPVLASVFTISPLTWHEWWLVFLFSVPVCLIDEVLKFVGRMMNATALKARLAEMEKIKKET